MTDEVKIKTKVEHKVRYRDTPDSERTVATTCRRCGLNFWHLKEYSDRMWEIMDWKLQCLRKK